MGFRRGGVLVLVRFSPGVILQVRVVEGRVEEMQSETEEKPGKVPVKVTRILQDLFRVKQGRRSLKTFENIIDWGEPILGCPSTEQ